MTNGTRPPSAAEAADLRDIAYAKRRPMAGTGFT